MSIAQRIRSLSSLHDDWNGHGAPAPNATAIQNALNALEIAQGMGIEPSKAPPSADGGVALVWTPCGMMYAMLEMYNEGDGAYMTLGAEMHFGDVDPSPAGITSALEMIKRFMQEVGE